MYVTVLRTQFLVSANQKRQTELLGHLAEKKVNVVAQSVWQNQCVIIVGQSDPFSDQNQPDEQVAECVLKNFGFSWTRYPVVQANLAATVGVPGTFFQIQVALCKAGLTLKRTYSGESESVFYDVGSQRATAIRANIAIRRVLAPTAQMDSTVTATTTPAVTDPSSEIPTRAFQSWIKSCSSFY